MWERLDIFFLATNILSMIPKNNIYELRQTQVAGRVCLVMYITQTSVFSIPKRDDLKQMV